jgi:antitoxin component of MazEF toxin-antitoxin module
MQIAEELKEMNRKLRKFGHSIGITFPLEIAKLLNLEADDNVRILTNLDGKSINIILSNEKRVTYPDVFLKLENGQYQLWNRLIMQEDINKILAYKDKIKLKSQVEELNGQKYFVIWL